LCSLPCFPVAAWISDQSWWLRVFPALLKCDTIEAIIEPEFVSVFFVLFFLDFFDAVGTVVGVAEQGGFYKNGKIPRVKQLLLA